MTQNNTYIESIPINLFNGILNSELSFANGLNIISGENGTGKTQIIQQLKSSGNKKFHNEKPTDKIVVFNPLRNSEKKTKEQVAEKLKSQGMSRRQINEALNAFNIDDKNLPSPYPSFPELFVISYEELVNSKKVSKRVAVSRTKEAFNKILKQVFPDYEIEAEWIYKEQSLNLDLKKFNAVLVPIEAISRGENEMFSLMFNIYVTRDDQDIYLIDEPELHLNWDLERGLFRFLDWSCEEFKKQIIVSTHSRVIFESEFLQKAQFLLWENNRIVVRDRPTDEIRVKIGGDALQLVTALDINKAVFYVEDEEHKKVVEFLSQYPIKKDIVISPTGNKVNVRNICRYSTKEGLKNAYFLVDGDNEGVGDEFQNNNQYIQLQKYCIENYFLNYTILASIANKSEQDIRDIVQNEIKIAQENKHTKVFKKLAEAAIIPEDILDTYNGKQILDKVSTSLGFNDKTELIKVYLETCRDQNKLDAIFGEITEKIKQIQV